MLAIRPNVLERWRVFNEIRLTIIRQFLALHESFKLAQSNRKTLFCELSINSILTYRKFLFLTVANLLLIKIPV